MSSSFYTENNQTCGGYALRSLPQRRRRQSLGGEGDGKDMHWELLRKEIEKIQKMRQREREREREAQEKMNTTGNMGRINSHDITGEEFWIVCEELWIDFKLWANRDENIKNSSNMLSSAISQNLHAILFVGFFAVLFRWYVGAGRDACSYGIGYGAFSFMCEVLRYLGEIVVIMLLAIIGFCVGLLPLVIGVIIYEFNGVFPCGDGEGDDEDDGGEEWDDHQKKE
jgi:hypothetical protein